MQRRHLFLVLALVFTFLIFSSCNEETDPISPGQQTYETFYGDATRVDNYPLYSLDYTTDYKFDEYLQTGIILNYIPSKTGNRNFSCTCFSAFGENSRLLGRNYDWNTGSSYFILFTNPPNAYSSVSTVDLSFFNYNHEKSPASTDNQNTIRILPYFPFDGINEKGVAIGMNAVPYAQSPYDGSKITIGELQLIRLVLDYANSTQHAINLIQQYNIRMEEPPIHYLIADKSGHSAIVEFVNGNMEVMHNSEPFQVTTNFVITGLNNPHSAPCWRYITAYETLFDKNGVLSISDAKYLLQDVSVSITRWSSIYNLIEGKLQIAMGRNYQNLHYFEVP
jgi:hypothetical protein